jgi:hypothetical protein
LSSTLFLHGLIDGGNHFLDFLVLDMDLHGLVDGRHDLDALAGFLHQHLLLHRLVLGGHGLDALAGFLDQLADLVSVRNWAGRTTLA